MTKHMHQRYVDHINCHQTCDDSVVTRQTPRWSGPHGTCEPFEDMSQTKPRHSPQVQESLAEDCYANSEEDDYLPEVGNPDFINGEDDLDSEIVSRDNSDVDHESVPKLIPDKLNSKRTLSDSDEDLEIPLPKRRKEVKRTVSGPDIQL